MHTKDKVTVMIDGKERVRTRVACEETGKSFTITHRGSGATPTAPWYN